MAISDNDVHYSWKIAFIYVFNLIVGAGALALPLAFAKTGWILGLVALAILALMSYCTSTFMIEVMSIANAVIRLKAQEELNKSQEGSSVTDDMEVLTQAEKTPLLMSANNSDLEADLYEISIKVEMGQLARMFFNKVGIALYYIVISLYLYGDLAIYAAAVPKSLTTAVCGGTDIFEGDISEPCLNINSMCIEDMYRIMLVVFVTAQCPFVFFNLAKTKVLQMVTTVFRWIAFLLMVILALIKIVNHEGPTKVAVFSFSNLPNFFGVAVYAFMCQHSLPSIVTPVMNKGKINLVIFIDFMMVLLFYVLLVITAVFSVAESKLEDLYTLNFSTPVYCKYFLELFPVFTLSTNFPIIAITLRENLKTLFLKEDRYYGLFLRRFLFPLITVIPPIGIAFVTSDVGLLVSVTGSYAGAVIQYIIPVLLVFYGRIHMRQMLGAYRNKYRSPFRHRWWIFFVVFWYVACVIFVTVDHINHN